MSAAAQCPVAYVRQAAGAGCVEWDLDIWEWEEEWAGECAVMVDAAWDPA